MKSGLTRADECDKKRMMMQKTLPGWTLLTNARTPVPLKMTFVESRVVFVTSLMESYRFTGQFFNHLARLGGSSVPGQGGSSDPIVL